MELSYGVKGKIKLSCDSPIFFLHAVMYSDIFTHEEYQCTDTLIIKQTCLSVLSSAVLDFLAVSTTALGKICLADE